MPFELYSVYPRLTEAGAEADPLASFETCPEARAYARAALPGSEHDLVLCGVEPSLEEVRVLKHYRKELVEGG